MVSFEWYRSFLEVYRVGTVSAAANRLYLTQPTVSQHLAALEAEIGEPLFIRTPRKMVATEKGKELYTHVAQAIDRLESVSKALRLSQSSERPLFKLGTPVEFFQERFVEILDKCSCRIWVKFGLTSELIDSLKEGDLDVVVATKKFTVVDIEYQKIAQENFLLVGSSKIEIPKFDQQKEKELEIIKQWLENQMWISYSTELPIIRRVWQKIFKIRPEFSPTYIIPNLHAILKAVQLGLGVTLLPEYICKKALEEGSIQILYSFSDPIENDLWLAYKKTDRNHPLLKQILEQISE
nr:LysR family transcriptional regulator [Blastocatellia bacterium]